ncbi:hypothetical protein PROFUN_13675 [Planoprotostelium fungivorum]|uniref:Uncharacterized protein n=1 Tax=Planoprotostelium fungivorum TaxID=1890364 RepID=A0A2P6MUK8_9EUKA|nr:hypothetical protein PROFUN_13675 [Planoprotostelium fungivorum]
MVIYTFYTSVSKPLATMGKPISHSTVMVIYTFYTSVSKPLATMGKTISHITVMVTYDLVPAKLFFINANGKVYHYGTMGKILYRTPMVKFTTTNANGNFYHYGTMTVPSMISTFLGSFERARRVYDLSSAIFEKAPAEAR